jgi:hypothetical protein
MKTIQIFALATVVAIISFSLGVSLGYFSTLGKNLTQPTTTLTYTIPQTIFSPLTYTKTETTTSTDFTEITPIYVTSVTTTTLSTATKTIFTNFLQIRGDNLSENLPYLYGNSTLKLTSNNSNFVVYVESSAVLTITINGNKNIAYIGAGLLDLTINGNSNDILTFYNQTTILSQQINGTGNNVSAVGSLP